MTTTEFLKFVKDPAGQKLLEAGYKGFRVIGSTFSATAGEVFHKLEVVVAADITATNSLGGDNPDGTISYPATTEMAGYFDATTVSVTTGTVIGYLI